MTVQNATVEVWPDQRDQRLKSVYVELLSLYSEYKFLVRTLTKIEWFEKYKESKYILILFYFFLSLNKRGR